MLLYHCNALFLMYYIALKFYITAVINIVRVKTCDQNQFHNILTTSYVLENTWVKSVYFGHVHSFSTHQ